MKTIYNIILFLIISCVSNAQSASQMTTNVLKANEKLILNGKEYTNIPSTGGQVFLEDYTGSTDFGVRLQSAINSLPAEGGIINCRGVGGPNQTMNDAVNINKPVRILLGQMTLTMSNTGNENMFNIQSSGVDIIGLGRSVKGSIRTGKTKLVMANEAGNVLQGYHIYNRGNSSITIKDLDMEGKRTELGEQYNVGSGITGVGGIYMEKAEPEEPGSGNVVSQIILDGLYIENTKAHGIYIDGPMLSSINNVRISGAGGHGIFINAGTTCNLNSVYVSSAHFAGVCLKGLSYSSVMNSAAETCSIGWWLRGCNSISVFNSGVEATKNLGFQPWGASGPYGLNLHTYASNGTTEVDIKDINSDYANDFRGTGYLISGGECISLFSPYCKDPGRVEEDNESDSKTRFFKITGDVSDDSSRPKKDYNWNSRIVNPQLKKQELTNLINQFDIEITYKVENLRLEWDPEENGVVTPTNSSDIVANTTSTTQKAPLFNGSITTFIRCGNKEFTLSD